MKEKEFETAYGKWRTMIQHTNISLALLTFVVEVFMYFVLESENLILQPLPAYLWSYLILPTILNSLIMLTGTFFAKKINEKNCLVNYIPILQLEGICLVVAMTHYIFSVTLCAFCLPIFTTIIFSDKNMTRMITALSVVCSILVMLHRKSDTGFVDLYLISEGIAACAILISTNIICGILIRFQNEKSEAVAKAHQHQLTMRELLNRDQKTGLYGSTAFSNAMIQFVEKANGAADPLILAILDIDDFKKVNDTYGHAQGDKVIIRLADLMKQYYEDSVFPARFGGEEFAVLFDGHSLEAVCQSLNSLRREFSWQNYDFMEQKITLSIGIAAWQQEWTEEELFNHADEAMYHSKQDGKNKITLWEPALEKFQT